MGKLYVVGIGPGDEKHMTAAAREAIAEAEVICGYTLYIDLIRHMSDGKELYATPMTREMDRCRYALEKAGEGKTAALICSGDAGVYGLAAPALTLADGVDVEVIPGVSAAQSGASILGAPLTDDHCIISLSDINTPWEMIEKRLELASEADLVIVLYNPMSKHRPDTLRKACEAMLRKKNGDTVCGYVRNIARPGEEKKVLTLSELKNEKLDMFATVFVGNSRTENRDGRMITPRGYRDRK